MINTWKAHGDLYHHGSGRAKLIRTSIAALALVMASLLGATPASAATERPSGSLMAFASGIGTNSMKFG
ncbi:hypothetical protein PV646_23140 [Streptomyces sp. ID05-26A]|nr:hypothetical protein [Streptomyces sp. ID05-26A]